MTKNLSAGYGGTYLLVILAHGRQKQEDQEFKTIFTVSEVSSPSGIGEWDAKTQGCFKHSVIHKQALKHQILHPKNGGYRD